jgi:hypothetical protein
MGSGVFPACNILVAPQVMFEAVISSYACASVMAHNCVCCARDGQYKRCLLQHIVHLFHKQSSQPQLLPTHVDVSVHMNEHLLRVGGLIQALPLTHVDGT